MSEQVTLEHFQREIRSQNQHLRKRIDELEAKINSILVALNVQEGLLEGGARDLDDGRTFLPGTGTLNNDPNRPRTPEVQAAIERDERERQ